MGPTATDRIVLNTAAQAILRILVASYFLAVALQIIPGTDLSVLFATLVPAPFDAVLATGLVFLLSFMIMIAMHTRVAALLLGLMTFFASYLNMVSLGVADELGAFWRDLTLIAALVLTYGDSAPSGHAPRRMFHRRIVPRRVLLETPTASPRRLPPMVLTHPVKAEPQAPVAKPRRVAADSGEIDNIFAA